MPLPETWTQKPVVGDYREITGKLLAGKVVSFTCDRVMAFNGEQRIVPGRFTATLDSDGKIPSGFTLPALDDPLLDDPTGTYTVKEHWTGGRTFSIAVSVNDTEVNMATVSPVADPQEWSSVEEAALASALGVAATAAKDAAESAADTATTKANEAAISAQAASDSADAAALSESAAEASQLAAENARDAAQASGNIYADTTAGLAATTDGDYFSVPSAEDDEYLILYLNDSGSATEVKRYPSAAVVQGILGGATVSDQQLKDWTLAEALRFISVTRNSDGVATSASIAWPDGSAGTFTATTINSTFKVIDAFTITHTESSRMVTQAAVTRDTSGNVSAQPALSVGAAP